MEIEKLDEQKNKLNFRQLDRNKYKHIAERKGI